MGAASGHRLSTRRYRRRILGLGAVALAVTFVIGSAVTLARVEDDLRARVADALEEAGVDGVSISFSGQDGTVSCSAPLEDPERVRRIGEAERGVRSLELAPECQGGAAPDGPAAEPGETTTAPEPPPTATTSVVPTTAGPTTTSTSSTTTLPDPTTVLDIIVDDPQFSVLKNALEAVDMGALLGGADPVTIFAPTDDAFATLGPNFNAALASNPEALEAVLRHHVVSGDIAAADLADGTLTTSDGTTVEIDTTTGLEVVSGEVTAMVVDADLDAANGRVHVVDQVLLPDGLDLGVVAEVFLFVGRYEDGVMVLSGRVVSEGQRVRLVDAARRFLADDEVVDQLVVDAEVPLPADDFAALVELVTIVPRDLVVGEVVVSVDGVFVSGIAVEAGSIEDLAMELGASTALTGRPQASEAAAAALEQRLNDIVADDPIRFPPASAELAADSAVLDTLAAAAKSLGGVLITVEGHTDSDGSPGVNLALSRARAEEVAAALVERGVPAGDLVAFGRGSSEPILVDGVEDKAASRRVVFVVETE